MCQAFEAERNLMVWLDNADIRRKWERHKSGEEPLSDDELKRLAIQKMMNDER